MSAAGRVASKVGQAATKSAGRAAEAGSSHSGKEGVLNKGAKRDPELYVQLHPFECHPVGFYLRGR